MPEWVITLLTTLGTALLASGAGWFLWRSQRRKLLAEAGKEDAEAADLLTGSALEYVRELRTDMSSLRERIKELESAGQREQARIRELETALDAERRQIVSLSERVNVQAQRITALTQSNVELTRGVAILRRQLEQQGEAPAWVGPVPS